MVKFCSERSWGFGHERSPGAEGGDLGIIGITGDRGSEPQGVPAGKWKVLGTREPEAETDEETESGSGSTVNST